MHFKTLPLLLTTYFNKKQSKVIKPTKNLKSTINSTVKAASLFTYYNAISATFITLVNQKHHPTLGSITTEKISKISNTIPACKHFNKHDHNFNNNGKFIIIEQVRSIRTTSTETLKERLKQ